MQTIYDFQSQIVGIGFLKIHAPWNVLCREAEFMKLKMPTKKVLQPPVNLSSAYLQLIDLLCPAGAAPSAEEDNVSFSFLYFEIISFFHYPRVGM